MFETGGMDNALGPLEGHLVLVAGCRKSVYSLADLPRVGNVQASEHGPGEDTKPDLNLVEPGGVGGRVVHLGASSRPTVGLRFVGNEVVQDNMEFRIRVLGLNPLHEVRELPPSLLAIMSRMEEPFVASRAAKGFVVSKDPNLQLLNNPLPIEPRRGRYGI